MAAVSVVWLGKSNHVLFHYRKIVAEYEKTIAQMIGECYMICGHKFSTDDF